MQNVILVIQKKTKSCSVTDSGHPIRKNHINVGSISSELTIFQAEWYVGIVFIDAVENTTRKDPMYFQDSGK